MMLLASLRSDSPDHLQLSALVIFLQRDAQLLQHTHSTRQAMDFGRWSESLGRSITGITFHFWRWALPRLGNSGMIM